MRATEQDTTIYELINWICRDLHDDANASIHIRVQHTYICRIVVVQMVFRWSIKLKTKKLKRKRRRRIEITGKNWQTLQKQQQDLKEKGNIQRMLTLIDEQVQQK